MSTHLEYNLGWNTPVNGFKSVNIWIFWTYNYTGNFFEAFEEGSIREHLKSKFNQIYDTHGSNGVMNKFYVELSEQNRKQLVDWVFKNYKP